IYIGNTSNDTATDTHIHYNQLQLVYSSSSQSFTTGINTFTFSQPFEWDGVSNIVIQYNFSNEDSGNYTQAKSIRYIATSFASTKHTRADNRTATQILYTMTGAVSSSGGTYVTFFRPNYYINGSALCNSPRVEVIATVTPAPVVSLSQATTTVCSGEVSETITIAQGAEDFDTFVWEPATGVSGNAATGWTFNPTETTVYTLFASQSEGVCASSIELTVNVTSLPLPTTIVGPEEICENTIAELSAGYNVTGTATFGNSSATTPSTTEW